MREHVASLILKHFRSKPILFHVEQSDLFIVVGSSGHVYPAAGLVNVAQQAGAKTVLVNLEAPLNADAFDEVYLGKAGELLPGLLKALN